MVPVAPILFFWMISRNRVGNRWRKAVWFLAGTAIPFLPLLWPAVQGPRQTFFNLIEYHLLHRRPPWAVALWDDARTLNRVWLESVQGMTLVLMAGIGLIFLAGAREWETSRREEWFLCVWLTGGLGVYLACTSPTYHGYFVLVIPFLATLAALGAYAVGIRLCPSLRPVWVVLAVVGLLAVGTAKEAHHMAQHIHHFSHRWLDYEELAREVNQVTPDHGTLWADGDCNECLYSAARRVPPSGQENPYSRHVRLPSDRAASLHVLTVGQIDERLAAGRMTTVVIPHDDPRIESFGLPRRYLGRARMHGYDLFWDPVPHQAGAHEPRR